MKIYSNGNLYERETLSEVFEPGFLFGWGVFETFRAYGGKIPFLKEHVGRLNDGLNALGIEEVKLDFKTKIEELLKTNSLDDAYIRITAYKKRETTGVIIYVDKFGYYPKDAYEKGFSAIISPYKRNSENYFAQIKSLSYLENRMSWYEAQKRNKDEAIVLNEKGFIAGGSRSNLFMVKDNEVFTPALASAAFYGITRKAVVNELKNSRAKIKEKDINLEDLYTCDEAFLTSALLEIMPLVECEAKAIGKGTVGTTTLAIMAQYQGLLK